MRTWDKIGIVLFFSTASSTRFSERFRIGRKLHINTSWGNDFPIVLRRIPFSLSIEVRHSDPLVSLSFGRTAVFLLQISTAPAWVPEEDDT
jgi:hypothetical protein